MDTQTTSPPLYMERDPKNTPTPVTFVKCSLPYPDQEGCASGVNLFFCQTHGRVGECQIVTNHSIMIVLCQRKNLSQIHRQLSRHFSWKKPTRKLLSMANNLPCSNLKEMLDLSITQCRDIRYNVNMGVTGIEASELTRLTLT